MNIDSRTIDDIVAGVLNQLGTAAIVRAESESDKSQVVDATVLTEQVLREYSTGSDHLLLREDAVITPSGRDWLRQQKITWERTTTHPSRKSNDSDWRLFLPEKSELNENSNEAAEQLGWVINRVQNPDEQAVASLKTDSNRGAVVVSNQPERIVCRANRNSYVRAAVVQSVEDIKRVNQQLGANLLAVLATERSYFEVRNLFKAIAAGGLPSKPTDW